MNSIMLQKTVIGNICYWMYS